MTRREPRKVARIYAILDSLNVHKHDAFKTIVFSDTVLVYNPVLANTDDDRNYLVWYLIEFVEDLHHRLTGQDIYFRAVITAGNFSHYSLKNIECFFGEALVDAYTDEKDIPSIGLFIDKECNKYNKYFRVSQFDDRYLFVYLNRSIEELNKHTSKKYPINYPVMKDMVQYLPWQVKFLNDIHSMMRTFPIPSVRTKFINAWDFYVKRYPEMLYFLEKNGFSLSSLTGKTSWAEEIAAMERDIKYYKRIGSGSELSMQLTKRKRNIER